MPAPAATERRRPPPSGSKVSRGGGCRGDEESRGRRVKAVGVAVRKSRGDEERRPLSCLP